LGESSGGYEKKTTGRKKAGGNESEKFERIVKGWV